MGEVQLLEGDLQVLDDVSPEKVVAQISQQKGQEDPFFILNVGDVVQKLKNWRLKMPRVKVFYAVKCNDTKPVLEILKKLGTGFDCASKSELEKVKAIGVEGTRIIYAHPCKPPSHLKEARTFGVEMMTFDNESELYKVKEIMPNAKLVLRVRCDALKAGSCLGGKFGALKAEAKTLLQVGYSLGLNIIGVSFHVGSGCQEPKVFSRAIKLCRYVFDAAIAIGLRPYLLDVGGGFPVDDVEVFNQCAHYINEAIEMLFPVESGVEVIAEPGRYLVTSAFINATQIISKKDKLDDNGDVLTTMYYVNDGVFGSFRCRLLYHEVFVPTLVGSRAGPKSNCCIWGPTCDGLDQLVESILLPSMNIGDWLMWENMGAYTLTMASVFNGFPFLQVYPIISRSDWKELQDIMKPDSGYNFNWSLVVSPNGNTAT